MQTLSKRGACDTRSSGIILLAVTLAAGQVQFTRHLPQELGIDTVFSYIANSFVDYDGDGRPDALTNRKYGGNTYDTN